MSRAKEAILTSPLCGTVRKWTTPQRSSSSSVYPVPPYCKGVGLVMADRLD